MVSMRLLKESNACFTRVVGFLLLLLLLSQRDLFLRKNGLGGTDDVLHMLLGGIHGCIVVELLEAKANCLVEGISVSKE
ncbi:hypothetical protein F5Y07DRAFT_382918 [Xylaria sp. FL0933]|nr:hypothetical protein F5Y07DRAFT_382918 [Xylaria sp. FL0933]